MVSLWMSRVRGPDDDATAPAEEALRMNVERRIGATGGNPAEDEEEEDFIVECLESDHK